MKEFILLILLMLSGSVLLLSCEPVVIKPKSLLVAGTPTRTSTPAWTGTPTWTATPTVTSTPGLKRMFVTSQVYTGNFATLAAADSACDASAAGATLGGTWMAFLYTSTSSPVNRLPYDTWVRTDGVTIFNLTTDIINGSNPLVAPDIDEFGQAVTVYDVWTGAGGGNCSDWAGGPGLGTIGLANVTNPSWVNSFTQQNCTLFSNSLYCFEK